MSSKARTIRRFTERFLAADADRSFLRFEAEGAAAVSFCAAEGPANSTNPQKRPTFEMLAYSGGVLSVGWGGPVYVDLSGLRAADQVTVLLDHDRYAIAGQCLSVDISARQVKAAGILTGNVEDPVNDPAGKIALHARNGFHWPCSIGVAVAKVEEVQAQAKASVNGRSIAGPAYVEIGRAHV